MEIKNNVLNMSKKLSSSFYFRTSLFVLGLGVILPLPMSIVHQATPH